MDRKNIHFQKGSCDEAVIFYTDESISVFSFITVHVILSFHKMNPNFIFRKANMLLEWVRLLFSPRCSMCYEFLNEDSVHWVIK